MNRRLLLPAAYTLDQIAGDPEWFPHPVRVIGFAITRGEMVLRRQGQSNAQAFAAGAFLTCSVVVSTYWVTAEIMRSAYRRSRRWGSIVELVLGWTCLAARNLEQEATGVIDAVLQEDLPRSRARLSRIVGRDTAELGSQEISRAVIETVAESASDGVMAPMFYMAIGGVPLAMAYKAVNTLDSMIGHADNRYFYFGKTAARLDDLANYLPSRITALAIIAASCIVNHAAPETAWQIWLRDGSKHKSPNAGQPESAIAGALQVALGGENVYAGERIATQRMGQEFREPTPLKAAQAIRIVAVASILGLGVGVLFATIFTFAKRVQYDDQ